MNSLDRLRELEENTSSFPKNPRYPTAKTAKIRLEGGFVSSGSTHPSAFGEFVRRLQGPSYHPGGGAVGSEPEG